MPSHSSTTTLSYTQCRRQNNFWNCQFSTGSTVPEFWPRDFIYVKWFMVHFWNIYCSTDLDLLVIEVGIYKIGVSYEHAMFNQDFWLHVVLKAGLMMCTVDDDIDILWETDMLPTPLKTVYMFYLNWQTFIQTSIMCNVNILPINYIATSLRLVYTNSNFAYLPTTSTDTLKFQPFSIF